MCRQAADNGDERGVGPLRKPERTLKIKLAVRLAADRGCLGVILYENRILVRIVIIIVYAVEDTAELE